MEQPTATDIDRIIISFSGGKDSVASYLTAVREYPETGIELVFTDTGDEMPETYEYLAWFHEHIHPVLRIAQQLVAVGDTGRRKTDLVYLGWDTDVADFPEMGIINLFDEIRHRATSRPDAPPWPTVGLRFCTRALKINPFYRHVRHTHTKEQRKRIIIVKGLRAAESTQRKGKEDFYFEEEGGDFYVIWLAVYSLTTDEVFEMHHHYKVPRNPVYDLRSRSNCTGCPFASRDDLSNTLDRYGKIIYREYTKIEEETGYTWGREKTLLEFIETGSGRQKVAESCDSGYCDI